MKKTISAYSIVSAFLLIAFAATVNAQALYENPPNDSTMRENSGDYSATATTEGNVTSIDADGGVITIMPFVATNVNNNQVTVQIIPETKVYKDGNTINSSDIQINDVVSVEYYDDPAGLRAVTINVE